MATVNRNNIFTGGPDQLVTGAVFDAPAGSKLPTKAAETLDKAFSSSGYISDEGLKLTTDISTTDIKDWSGSIIRKILEAFEGTLAWEELEMSEEACKHAFGENAVKYEKAAGSNGNQLHISIGAELAPVRSWVFRIKDGQRRLVICVPNGQVTSGIEMEFKTGEPVKLPIELSCYPDEHGISIYIHTDDGQVASA